MTSTPDRHESKDRHGVRRGGWVQKFANAFRGVACGIRGENSFVVHFAVTAGVCGLAAWLEVDAMRWAILIVCIFGVLALELANSALERMAKAVDLEENSWIRDSLDIASGAVLVASIGAVIVGLVLLLNPLLVRIGWL